MITTLIGYARCPIDKRQKKLPRMHDTGEYAISDLAELFSVLRPTVYRTPAWQSAVTAGNAA